MNEIPRFLTKSRFKLAVECPTKLFYTGRAEYQDNSASDTFLQALAEGGYQVNALACAMYSGGVQVPPGSNQSQLDRTRELLKREHVTIFEAAFEIDGLFARADILRKVGNAIELIEVKAKSYDTGEDRDFATKAGGIVAGWLPYLHDIAFQRHVFGLAYPGLGPITCLLLLADNSKRTSVNGLNQRFKAVRAGKSVSVEVAPGTDATTLGDDILVAVNVDARVNEILAGTLPLQGATLPFAEAVRRFAKAYATSTMLTPTITGACGSCEFKTDDYPSAGGMRSGFHECWSQQLNWHATDFAKGTVLDLWNFRGKGKLLERKIYALADVKQADLGKQGSDRPGVTVAQRQWMQASGQWPGGGPFYLDRDGLAGEMMAWKFPLNLIDFETSTVAVPFTKGRRPYEQTAFQFSHHLLHEDGTVEHKTQYLNDTPGEFPNYAFLRELRAALLQNEGSVFRWADHENTVLNQLREQLRSDPSPPADSADLIAFTEMVTQRGPKAARIRGPRCMIDLCDIAEKFFFHPSTMGSSSLKKVLPALMASSQFLKERYSQPVYGAGGIKSLNWTEEAVCWWQADGDLARDPYDLLPPVFSDMSRDEQDLLDKDPKSILKEGGAALAAYGRLQFENLPEVERQHIRGALLRYCELDTLAMVMAVQAWMSWKENH